VDYQCCSEYYFDTCDRVHAVGCAAVDSELPGDLIGGRPEMEVERVERRSLESLD
jgi:hypothetical protein